MIQLDILQILEEIHSMEEYQNCKTLDEVIEVLQETGDGMTIFKNLIEDDLATMILDRIHN